MIKVEIKNKTTQQITHSATFLTQGEVDSWITECEKVEAWGKPAHQVLIPGTKDEQGNQLEPDTYQDVPAEYDIIQIDNTEEALLAKGIAKNEARIQFGIKVFAELAYRNKKRLIAGTTTVSEIFTAEEKLAKIQRLLMNSSTEKAYQDMLALDIPELPTEEKSYFLGKIAAYLAAE